MGERNKAAGAIRVPSASRLPCALRYLLTRIAAYTGEAAELVAAARSTSRASLWPWGRTVISNVDVISNVEGVVWSGEGGGGGMVGRGWRYGRRCEMKKVQRNSETISRMDGCVAWMRGYRCVDVGAYGARGEIGSKIKLFVWAVSVRTLRLHSLVTSQPHTARGHGCVAWVRVRGCRRVDAGVWVRMR